MGGVAAEAREVEYPASDGRPMGETGRHAWALMDLVVTLSHRLRDQPDVYVGGNQFLYWVEGDPTQVVCPDVYVVLDRPNRPLRDTWKVWEEEGRAPTFILELTSRSTRVTDLGAKRGVYELLGVREYAVFDPLGEYLRPRLRLWRLEGEAYAEVPAGAFGRWSEVLQLWLDVERGESRVRLRERDGAPVLRLEEVEERASRAEAERDRLLAEVERLRRG